MDVRWVVSGVVSLLHHLRSPIRLSGRSLVSHSLPLVAVSCSARTSLPSARRSGWVKDKVSNYYKLD